MGEDEPGHRSCTQYISVELLSRGNRDGRFCRTASGAWIPDGGAWQFQGYDENGLLRSLNGRLTDAHQVLCSAAEIVCKEQQDFYLGHDGGCMVPVHSKIGQGMRTHFEKLVNEYGKNDLISSLSREQQNPQCERCRPVFCEEESTVGKRVWQSSALVSPTKTLNRDVARIGDDIESMGNLVQMSKEETKKKNPQKQKFPQSR